MATKLEVAGYPRVQSNVIFFRPFKPNQIFISANCFTKKVYIATLAERSVITVGNWNHEEAHFTRDISDGVKMSFGFFPQS